MAKRVARGTWLVGLVLGVTAAMACGSRHDSAGADVAPEGGAGPSAPVDGGAAAADGGTASTLAGANGDAASGGLDAAAGTGEGGAAGNAERPDASGCDAADQRLGDSGELLYSAGPPCDAVGKGLFAVGDRLYWLYERGGKSYIAAGAIDGSGSEILVESDEPIGAFHVQGVIAYQVGNQLYALPLSARAPAEPVALAETASPCGGLASTEAHVYCRTQPTADAQWSDVVRCPVEGGALETGFRTHVGDELAVDDNFVYVVEVLGELNQLSYGALVTVPFRYVAPVEPSPDPGMQPPMTPHWDPRKDPIDVEPNGGRKGFGLHGLQIAAHGLVYLDATLEASRFEAGRSVSLPNGVTSYTPLVPVRYAFGPTPLVAIDEADGGSRLMAAEPDRATFEYRSAARVVAMASVGQRVFWLDRAGRVFAAAARPPEVGESDAFVSSLDEADVAQLTREQIETVCHEIAAYSPSEGEFQHSLCVESAIAYGVPEGFDSCESFVAYCEAHPEEQLAVEGPLYGEQDCIRELTSLFSCALNVREYSACRVAYADEERRLAPQLQCGADPTSATPWQTPFRACAYFDQWCR